MKYYFVVARGLHNRKVDILILCCSLSRCLNCSKLKLTVSSMNGQMRCFLPYFIFRNYFRIMKQQFLYLLICLKALLLCMYIYSFISMQLQQSSNKDSYKSTCMSQQIKMSVGASSIILIPTLYGRK